MLVISDTHIPNVAFELPREVIEEAKRSDIIIHAGDIISMDVISELKCYGDVYAVHGNMDRFDSVTYSLPSKLIVEIEGVKIGITHGSGGPWGIIGRVNRVFSNLEELNVIVFGHTHHPLIEKKDGRWYVNPGSPTDKRYAPYNSYAVLEIEGKEVKPTLVKIKGD